MSHLDGARFFFFKISHIINWPISSNFVGKRRRGRLVNWVEKASLERIRRLLKITKVERNHELLLFVKNLGELGASPYHYIFPVILRPMLAEPIKGEHFVLFDLLKSIPSSSLQAGSAQAEVVEGALVKFVRPDQFPLVEQDPQLASQVAKNKKKKKVKKGGHTKAAITGLKGFVDWTDPTASEPTKERENNMSSLVAGFFCTDA